MVRTARSTDDMALCCWVMICNARDMASAFPVASATAGPEDFDLDQADANARAAVVYRSLVLENVDVWPARHVQARPGRQKPERGLGQLRAAFALQKRVELGLERMQIEHV